MAQADQPEGYDDELARIDASIADLKIRDMAAAKERTQIASKLQAAQFQRDILAHANSQRKPKAARGDRKPRRGQEQPPSPQAPPAPKGPSRGPRRPPRSEQPPDWAAAGTPFTGPGGAASDGVTVLVDEPPPTERPLPPRRGSDGPPPPHPPEASSQSVQNILLALGALVIGVSAVVFAGLTANPLAGATILLLAAAGALALAPLTSARGLSSTAETVSVVGLVLLPMSLYALHDLVGFAGTPVPVFLGVIFLITAVVSFVYAGTTRLAAPRYATVVALQPVPLLLADPVVESPAGWGLALAVVALLDLMLLTTVIRRGRLVPRWPIGRPVAGDREGLAAADDPYLAGEKDYARQDRADQDRAQQDRAQQDRAQQDAYDEMLDRPESQPEEPDLIVPGLTGKRRRWLPTRIFPGPRPEGAPAAASVPLAPPATPPSADWLRELTFALLCVAVAGSLLYAGGALIGAGSVPDAVRSGLILILAGVTAVAAAHLLDNPAARNIAGAVLLLAVIGACARVAAVADPQWTLMAAAGAVAISGAVVGTIPPDVRRGPQLASAAALAILGLFVAVDALRAALAPVQAARPVWNADTAAYADRIAAAAGPSGWLLAVSALLLTFAAALALPADWRREGAVAGVALTALAVPSSLGLPWSEAPWPLVVAAIGLGAAGLRADNRRVAIAHVAAAGVVGLFGAGAALSAVWLTAAVLTALAGAGVMVAIAARQIPMRLYAWLIGDWAAGAAALALPGAAVTAILAMSDPGGGPPPTESVTVPALAAGFLAVAGTLAYGAIFQVARREISLPLTIGTGLGAVAMALAALLAPGATAADIWVGALLLAAAGLLFFANSIDSGRRSDRMLDGPDIAAAGATVAICGALARVGALAFPQAPLLVAGLVVVLIALGVRTLPEEWRRGPVRGLAVAGAVAGAIAAWLALGAGLRILAAPGPFWGSDISGYPANVPDSAWQAPLTLLVIAIAAAAALPPPHSYDVGAICAAVATIGAPACFGMAWWAPLLVGGTVALGYGVAAVFAWDPRAALARTAVAAVVAVHFVAVGLVRPWSFAAALLIVAVIGVLVATLARIAPALPANRDRFLSDDDDPIDRDDTGMPRHRAQIGGAATAGVLLAAPGILAGWTAAQGHTAEVVLAAALAGSALALAVICLVGRNTPQYLPWATAGLVLGATITAGASIPTNFPTALYAAAAALFGVIAELLRGAVQAPGLTVSRNRYRFTRPGTGRPSGLRGRWLVDPATGAAVVATLPTVLALFSLGPALSAALFAPFRQLGSVWDGPVTELLDPFAGVIDGTTVLAAVLLTVAAALAALGFGGRSAEAVPVILPGLAITLLVAPIALAWSWPASTSAALVVFTIGMLGLALTPPPVPSRAPVLRIARVVVFVLALMAGGAGLAGALATRPLTLFTLGSAVGVGLVAAMAGRSAHARIMGWVFAALLGQFFVLALALVLGLAPAWAAFGVLAVGAMLLLLEAALPRLGLPEYRAEATTVEWSGYASALLAAVLAYNSPEHLAALMAAFGAVLGLSATRPDRSPHQRRMLFWIAVGFEIIGWWLFMTLSDVVLPEAYTLPFAALALIVGVLEVRQRPDLSSWAAYGPALLAAFVPTVGIVIATDQGGQLRQVLLLMGALTTLIIGSRLQQQAPVVVGAVVTAIVSINFAVTLVGPWLVLVPVGLLLLVLGATNENRRRTQERVRGALVRMR